MQKSLKGTMQLDLMETSEWQKIVELCFTQTFRPIDGHIIVAARVD